MIRDNNVSPSIMNQLPQLQENQEEIMIMGDVNEILKHFLKRIVWHDPNIHSIENVASLAELQIVYDVQTFDSWQDASEYLKKETQLAWCQVITSETDGERLVKEISNLPYIHSIYVLCSNGSNHTTWAGQYPKIVCVENKLADLLKNMKRNITKPSLRVDLPSFAPIFNDKDLSEMNHLHFYLKGLNFQKRDQARNDFLKLAKALYGKDQYIKKFEESYNQYNMNDILKWYTEDCFLYKLTNNCLRLAESDSILYCRLILKDLETAIKDKYKQQSHKFSGLLYRGAYLSDTEWVKLQQNVHREIEMHGFLSTTKRKDIAIAFCQEDMDKKVLITFIVPNFPDKGDQGFAEMKEHSSFPTEEEVLFNVRSRFTVLEAAVEEVDGVKIRHLVLLYGAQAMRLYTSLHDPCIEVKISDIQTAECQQCKRKINSDNADGFTIAVEISSNNEYLCKYCIQQPDITRKLVLLSLPSSQNIELKIEGIIIPDQDVLAIPFYGVKCDICQISKPKCCAKCLECKHVNKIYCSNCLQDQTSDTTCIKQGHAMVLQGYPFGFWSDKMTESEKLHLDYQKREIKETDNSFQQGLIFTQTHKYEKAIKYFEKYLEQEQESTIIQTAECYNYLGQAYNGVSNHQKAVECHSKALEINKLVLGENHSSTATSYDSLGVTYNNLGEYQGAIEYCSKSLEIRKVVFGDIHPRLADSLKNLGTTYFHLGQHKKAIECHSKSLEIRRAVYGDNDPSTASSYEDLGRIYRETGEFSKAVEYYSNSLEINKAVFGENHPSTAYSYNHLGIAYNDLGEYQKAIGYYTKTLEIRKTLFGDKHLSLAVSYTSLGYAFYSLAKFDKAIECYSKSLEINKTVLRDSHPSTAASYNNLGNVYNDLGEYQKAIEHYTKSLEIRKAVFEHNHPDIYASYNNLGNSYNSLKEYQKAIDYHLEALEISKVLFGEQHLDTADSYNNLGVAHNASKDYKKAKEYHSKSLEINKAVLGDNHPKTAISYNNLGNAYDDLGEFQKAKEYYFKALAIWIPVFGDYHPYIAEAYNNLAISYKSLGEHQKVLEYRSKALNVTKVVFGDNHSNTSNSYTKLGDAYNALGQYEEAIECYSKSFEIRKTVLGENHPRTLEAYNILQNAKQTCGMLTK